MIEPFDSQRGRETLPGQDRRERTLIVVCEFTGQNIDSALLRLHGRRKALFARYGSRGCQNEGDLRSLLSDSAEARGTGLPQQISDEAAECRELAISAGANVLDVILQRRDHPDPATLVGEGKLEEISAQANASPRGPDRV